MSHQMLFNSIFHSNSPLSCWTDVCRFGLQNHIEWGYITTGPHDSAYFHFVLKNTLEAKAAIGAFLREFNYNLLTHKTIEELCEELMAECIYIGTPNLPKAIVDRLLDSVDGYYLDFFNLGRSIRPTPTNNIIGYNTTGTLTNNNLARFRNSMEVNVSYKHPPCRVAGYDMVTGVLYLKDA